MTSAGLWRQAPFRRLWVATTVSQLGTQVSELAVPLTAVLTLGVTPFGFGLLATAGWLPILLVSLPAGAWLDRVRRRPVLVAGDLGRALALVSIPIAYALHGLSIWQLYVVALVVGSLTVVFDLGSQAYVPSLVDRARLVDANSKLQVSEQGSGVIGPALGGVLIRLLGAPVAILADVASYLASAASIVSIGQPEAVPAAADHPTGRPGLGREIAEGLRYALGHPYLRPMALTSALASLFGRTLQVVVLLYLVRGLGLNAAVIGLIFSIGSLGFVGGALLAERVVRVLDTGRTLAASSLLYSLAFLPIAVSPRRFAAAAVAAGFFLYGLGALVWTVNSVSLRQAITPIHLMGRVGATQRFIAWGALPLAGVFGGGLATVLGVQRAVAVSALCMVSASLPVLLSRVPRLRGLPEDRQAVS